MNKDEIEGLKAQINEMKKLLQEAKQNGVNGSKIIIIKQNLKKSIKLLKKGGRKTW